MRDNDRPVDTHTLDMLPPTYWATYIMPGLVLLARMLTKAQGGELMVNYERDNMDHNWRSSLRHLAHLDISQIFNRFRLDKGKVE